jgi:hypothetical protein
MSAQANKPADAATDAIGLDALLVEISRESSNLSEQCGRIQWSISAMLDIVDHPDLGAEIHVLQDIDRIQQTLADIAAILVVTGEHADGAPILKDEIGAAIRLESLRQRLGLSVHLRGDTPAPEASDITWL